MRLLDEDSDNDFDGYVDEDDMHDEGDDEESEEPPQQPPEEPSPSTEANPTVLSEYQQRVGCTVDMTNKTPVDFFHLFITDQMLEEIVRQTNIYAQQFLGSASVPPKSRANLWNSRTHDLEELKKFLSLVIVMGMIHFPAMEDYWVRAWPFANTNFSSVLKRDRFSLLLRFLHLNDSAHYIPKGQPGHDPLYKIRPFMDSLLVNFSLSMCQVS